MLNGAWKFHLLANYDWLDFLKYVDKFQFIAQTMKQRHKIKCIHIFHDVDSLSHFFVFLPHFLVDKCFLVFLSWGASNNILCLVFFCDILKWLIRWVVVKDLKYTVCLLLTSYNMDCEGWHITLFWIFCVVLYVFLENLHRNSTFIKISTNNFTVLYNRLYNVFVFYITYWLIPLKNY